MSKKLHIFSFIVITLSLLVLFGVGKGVESLFVEAASSDDILAELDALEEKNKEIKAEIEALRSQLSDNLNSLSAMMSQKELVDQEISLLNEQIRVVNEQIAACTRLIADKQAELDVAQAELKAMQEKNKERIRAMEENGEMSYWSVLAEANSFAEMLDHWELVQEIAKADEQCMKELSTAAVEVKAAREELTTQQTQLQDQRVSLDEVELELVAKQEETNDLLVQISDQGREYEDMIEDSESMQEDLMEEIAQKNEEYDDAKYQEWLEYQQWLESQKPQGGTATESGGYTWLMPCTYSAMTSPFGYRWHPISGVWKMHNGVDLAGNAGTPILATRSGIVTVAAYQAGGAGWYVSLKHDGGYASIYMHMTHFIVTEGQYVEAGQVIGYMGTSGGSTGVHLHFGISKNGVYVDPAEYVNIV